MLLLCDTATLSAITTALSDSIRIYLDLHIINKSFFDLYILGIIYLNPYKFQAASGFKHIERVHIEKKMEGIFQYFFFILKMLSRLQRQTSCNS